MLPKTLAVISVVAASLVAQSASADDFRFYSGRPYGYGYGYRSRHHDLHSEYAYREYNRELEHRDAHRYPMTWRQHERLHDALEYDAYRDAVHHSRWHHRNDWRYYRGQRGGVYFGGGSTRIFIGW